jgi:predicted permease
VALLLEIFVNDILPICIVAVVGFLLARYARADVRTLSKLVFNACSPCLVFTLLLTSSLGANDVGRMALFTAGAIIGIGILARGVAAALRLDRQATAAFLLVVMFANAGNFGLSAVAFAFGREALTHASIYFVTSAAMTYTVGVFIAASGRLTPGQALVGVLRVPVVYGVALGLVVMYAGVRVPPLVMRPVTLLSDAAIPVMLLVLGMQFEKGRALGRATPIVAASVLTLVVSPLVGFGLAGLIGFTGVARQAAIAQTAMPAAVATTILAIEYDVSPSFVTGTVLLTTLFSPLTVTLVFALLKR